MIIVHSQNVNVVQRTCNIIFFISAVLVVDSQAWPFSVFTPKQVFGPHIAKSQPI